MSNAPEFSESGNPIYRHEERQGGFQPADSSDSSLEEITNHIETHLGPIESVFHEIVSDIVHIDVHWVKATDERPFHSLITTGMSDLPMTVPDECEELQYAELMVNLPAEWPIDEGAFKDEANYWPVRWLKQMARLPHEYETWLAYGHTVPNGDPAEPFDPSVGFSCMLLTFPWISGPDFASLEVRDDKTINFWSLMPLYDEETDLKLREGTEALEKRFEKHNIIDLVDVSRRNVAKRRFFGLF